MLQPAKLRLNDESKSNTLNKEAQTTSLSIFTVKSFPLKFDMTLTFSIQAFLCKELYYIILKSFQELQRYNPKNIIQVQDLV